MSETNWTNETYTIIVGSPLLRPGISIETQCSKRYLVRTMRSILGMVRCFNGQEVDLERERIEGPCLDEAMKQAERADSAEDELESLRAEFDAFKRTAAETEVAYHNAHVACGGDTTRDWKAEAERKGTSA